MQHRSGLLLPTVPKARGYTVQNKVFDCEVDKLGNSILDVVRLRH